MPARSGWLLVVLAIQVALVPTAEPATPYFVQGFDTDSTFEALVDTTFFYYPGHQATPDTEHVDYPHVEFNDVDGGHTWATPLVDYGGGAAGTSNALEVILWKEENYGRAISYYLGGRHKYYDRFAYFSPPNKCICDAFVPDTSFKEMYLRYYVKFAADFVTVDSLNNQGKLPGLAGTYNAGAGDMWPHVPDSLGWSARMLWGHRGGDPQNMLHLFNYVYHLGQLQHSGDPGPMLSTGQEDYARAADIVRDQWYRIEQRVKLNTHPEGQPVEDGIVETWIDGAKQDSLCRYNLKYTAADSIGINRLWADIYYGGDYTSPDTNTVYLDEFYVSSQPTPWSGTLVGNSTWQDSVHLDGDVTIPAGRTLNIAPGTKVDLDGHDLAIDGTLRILGDYVTQGNMRIPDSGVLQIDGAVTVAAGDSLVIESGGQISQGATGRLLVDGVLYLRGDCSSGGGNVIVGAGPATVGGVLTSDGTFTVEDGDTLTVHTGAILTYGVSGHVATDGDGVVQRAVALVDTIGSNEWNYVSWPVRVDAGHDSIRQIVAAGGLLVPGTDTTLIQVLGYESQGIRPSGGIAGAKVYNPKLPPSANTLKRTDFRLGYEIRQRCADTLYVIGVPVPDTTSIALSPTTGSWALVSYFRNGGNAIPSVALGSITDSLELAETIETSVNNPTYSGGPGEKLFYPGLPQQSTMDFMAPHLGYWLKIAGSATLQYASKSLLEMPVVPTRKFMFVWGYVTIDGKPAPAGTAVSVRDGGGVLAGRCAVEEPGLYGALAIYLDDPETPLDEGATQGEPLALSVNERNVVLSPETRPKWTAYGDVVRLDLDVGEAQRKDRGDASAPPSEFGLQRAYPNPFNPATRIAYQLPQAVPVAMVIYDLQGQVVRRLVEQEQPAGCYNLIWDGRDNTDRIVASGVYLCWLRAGDYRAVTRMVLMK